ncbi:MAG: hypothetical protein LIO56_03760 [Lachnospiraceae bacterium]|nr:hypothetical protein [Lachnospiraceae bacterium]
MIRIIREWLKWHKDWDDLCSQCGQCCHRRSVGQDGEVIIHADHCAFLDEETHLCSVYPERFQRCPYCRKVNLRVVLFNPTLPNDCSYRKTFRR